MAIDQVRVRARISVGSINVSTPYILSFNVNKARGQVGTFSAKLKVKGSVLASQIIASAVKIEAGEDGPNNTIFTGIVKHVSISPCWDDPTYVNMDISGEDWLSLLQGKKYTRRVTADTASWVSIDGVARRGVRSGKFKAKMVGKIDALHSDILSETATVHTSPLASQGNIPVAKAPEGKTPLPTAAGSKIKSSST